MSRRSIAGLAVVTFALAGCGAGSPATSAARLPAADVVVGDWIDAIGSSDTAALDGLVALESLAFVVGVESRLDPADITALIEDGLPDELVGGYWDSFAAAFEAIDGRPIDDLRVGATREFDAAGARYSAVSVGDGDRVVEILVRRSLQGRWQVDMLATVGSGMMLQLVDLAERATDDRFRTLFEQWVFPALEAGSLTGTSGSDGGALREVRLAFDAAS